MAWRDIERSYSSLLSYYGSYHKAQKFALKGYRKVAVGGWGETEEGKQQRYKFNVREAERRALAMAIDMGESDALKQKLF